MNARYLAIIITLLMTFSWLNANAREPVDQKAKPFINHMVKKYHFSRKKLEEVFAGAKYDQAVIDKITHPYEKQPWPVYRAHFLTDDRIEDGADYLREHKKTLQRAYQKFGVSPTVIVAIIGVESNYTEHTGTYSALNTLSTLAFYYPRRSRFFTNQLEQLFLLARDQKRPVTSFRSSYAGAIGIPQFMPGIYRAYAVSGSKGKPIDLSESSEDAIFSVANYFKKHGWKRNQPVAVLASTKGKVNKRWLSKRAVPKYRLNTLKKNGILPTSPFTKNLKAAVIALPGKEKTEYWITFANFKTIMRYNPRINYAMAVYQLSQAISNATNLAEN